MGGCSHCEDRGKDDVSCFSENAFEVCDFHGSNEGCLLFIDSTTNCPFAWLSVLFHRRKMVFDWSFLSLAESFPGIVIVLTVAFFWLLGFSFEQSGLVKFSAAALKEREERVRSVLARILRILPRLLGLASFKAGIFLLCILPALRILPVLQRAFSRELPVECTHL